MSPEEPLPPLYEGLLDEAGVEALLNDLGALAELREARLKGAPTELCAADSLSFAEAARAWRGGSARALQLRYRYAGREWSDTLLRTPAGTRVVRIELPDPERAPSTGGEQS